MNVPSMIENKVRNSLHGSILNLLNTDYKFIIGEKVQEMFATDVVELIQTCYRDSWKLDVGQVVWYGAIASEKPHFGKHSRKTPLTPVILTLISSKDLDMKNAGFSDREIRAKKVVRLFFEAYEQNALLTHSDVAFLLHISTGTVSKHVKEYMERTGKIVPTRGIMHDIGRAVTHKKIIIKLHKKGYQLPEISRKTNHTEIAADRYIKAYERVKKLYTKMPVEQISQILGMGRSLVNEYVELIDTKEVNT